MNNKPFRFVQVSDTHLFADQQAVLLGVKTEDSLNLVVTQIKADAISPQLMIITGDLSQDRSESAYHRLVDTLQVFDVPLYWIPGNHDDPLVMAKVYPYRHMSNQKQLIIGNWQLILLDSQKRGAVEGALSEQQLTFMTDCLRQYPDHHTMIIFHHQPIPVGSRWLDRLGLENAAIFWQRLEQYPQARHLLFGHVHQQHESVYQNVHCYSVPSTCVQFARNSDNFALEKIAPGYRVVDLYPDGHLETRVYRASHVPEFDPKATGY